MKPLPGRLVLLGHPVAHSLSPTFQNAALRRAALPITYEAVDVPPYALDSVLDALVRIGGAGNATIPLKEPLAARCDRLTALAQRVGAVNTFWVEDGALVGDNTDVGGFLELLTLGAPRADRQKPAAVLGAGGAAAAVLAALERESFREIRVHSRSRARSVALCERFAPLAHAADHGADAVAGAGLVINATPVGLYDDGLPADVAALDADSVVLDLVYRRGETAFVRAARAHGHPAADGLAMLLAQGALAFERWFGFAPDRATMRAALEG